MSMGTDMVQAMLFLTASLYVAYKHFPKDQTKCSASGFVLLSLGMSSSHLCPGADS